MDLLTSRRSYLLAPALALVAAAGLLLFWAFTEPLFCIRFFDNCDRSPFELMTFPLFGLVIPLAWLCCPVGGTSRRKALWSAVFSWLGVFCVVRDTDLLKIACRHAWPGVDAGFNFKMKFFANPDVPLLAKAVVFAFYATTAAALVTAAVRWAWPLLRGFFRLEPVAWTVATFGAFGVFSQMAEKFGKICGAVGVEVTPKLSALFTVFEEGGESISATVMLLALLQSYLFFGRPEGGEGW